MFITLRSSLSRGSFVCIAVFHFLHFVSYVHTAIQPPPLVLCSPANRVGLRGVTVFVSYSISHFFHFIRRSASWNHFITNQSVADCFPQQAFVSTRPSCFQTLVLSHAKQKLRHPLCSAQKNAIPHRFVLRFFCFYKGRSRFSLRYATIKTLLSLPRSTRSRLARTLQGIISLNSLFPFVFPTLAQGCFPSINEIVIL